MKSNNLKKLAKLVRYYILASTVAAGSGHPTSSLSAVDLMTVLMFGNFFRFDFAHRDNLANDRLIFSKGHASPLFYALYLAAGVITPHEMMTLRKFGSRLEGHATPRFPYTEVATGSLGQGLSVGVGMALALKMNSDLGFKIYEEDKRNNHKSKFIIHKSAPRVYVLLGDSEIAEGAVWEAVNLASYYKLSNLVAIVDVNRLGQTGETMLGWDTGRYKKRFEAFGWETAIIDGHDYKQILQCYHAAILQKKSDKPIVIIAKTIKGKGVSFWENKNGWHGKPILREQLDAALKELGKVDLKIRGKVSLPQLGIRSNELRIENNKNIRNPKFTNHNHYKLGDQVATRKAFGLALARLGETYPMIVSLDAEVSNSTYAEIFREKFPDRFFEMFVAEQNMVGAAVGFARLGFIPFVSSFAAFLTRGFDQIRMAAISGANVKFCGSHAGVSIGEDGPSQMGLEDIAMFRAVHSSVVLYPADAVATEKLVEEMVKHKGICYLRTTRPATLVIYDNNEKFPIGGIKIHYPQKTADAGEKASLVKKPVIIIAAGITLFEALKAQGELGKRGIEATVVDCYSIKPIGKEKLAKLVSTLKNKSNAPVQIVTVEDHWYDGGLGDAVLAALSDIDGIMIHKLAVSKMPQSGKPQELLDFEKISARAIVAKVLSII
jgi:transketolase